MKKACLQVWYIFAQIPKYVLLGLIKMYQIVFSLDHAFWVPRYKGSSLIRVCIHYPSCSMYMYEAVEKYGAIKGGYMGFKRVLRCHPFAKGGYDPVP